MLKNMVRPSKLDSCQCIAGGLQLDEPRLSQRKDLQLITAMELRAFDEYSEYVVIDRFKYFTNRWPKRIILVKQPEVQFDRP